MATMRQSLEALKEKCHRFKVDKVAIPHIGCGLDKLNWPQVRSLIIEIFSDTGITINAYEFNAVSIFLSVVHALLFLTGLFDFHSIYFILGKVNQQFQTTYI